MALRKMHWLFVAVWLVHVDTLPAQQNPTGQLPVTSFDEPYLLLVRDPVVQADLRVSSEQQQAITALTDELDLRMWAARNQPGTKFADTMRELTLTARERLRTTLSFAQFKRLEQIRYWTRGMKFLFEEDVAQKISLTGDQQRQVEEILADVAKKSAELRKKAADKSTTKVSSKALDQEADELALEQHRRISAVLSRDQLGRVRALVGQPIELTKLGHVKFKAPEFAGEGPWLNSSPVRLADLRGKVVVVHFYAFGCINCVRNQPHYRQWHADLAGKNVVLIGIHTPETSNERDLAKVRAAAAETNLKYPIVIDNDQRMWNAWGNSMWPSTYVIDKHGYVRAWWYGELNWEGQDGEKRMRQRIEELLAED